MALFNYNSYTALYSIEWGYDCTYWSGKNDEWGGHDCFKLLPPGFAWRDWWKLQGTCQGSRPLGWESKLGPSEYKVEVLTI